MPDAENQRLWELYRRCEYGKSGLEPDPGRYDAELELYTSLSPAVMGYVKRLGFSDADALEINQEVFVALAKKQLLESSIRSLRSYSLGIARYKVAEFLRKRKLRFEDIAEHQDFTADIPTENEDEERLVLARKKLKYSFQEVLALYYDEGMTVTEVAAVLNEPVKRIESRKNRAVTELARIMGIVREK